MGLIQNLLLSVVHLAFVAMDILMIVILIRVIYNRWRLSWLKQAITLTNPLTTVMLNYSQEVMTKITGKTHSEKTLWLVIIIFLSLIRLIITNLL